MRFDAAQLPFLAGLRFVVVLALLLIGACRSDSEAVPALPDAATLPDAAEPATEGGSNREDARVDAPDAAVDAGSLMPCGDVSGMGRCASETRVEVCITQTGSATPGHLSSYECKDGEVCEFDGNARCKLVVECESGDTRCNDADTLETCVSGSWASSECASRCVASALGSSCAPNVPTKSVNGTLRYEARAPNVDLTNWTDPPSALPARHFVVLSYAGDSVLDATTTDELGTFSLLAPATPGADDHLSFVAAGKDARGQLAFAVADAGHASSASALREPFSRPPDPSVWSWSTALDAFANDQVITLTESAGSGAAHIFETLHAVFHDMEAYYSPKTTPTVVVWVSPGTAWTCGACMTPFPIDLAGQTFEHQVALDGSAKDQGYWSDAVSAHELGHYVMAAYGYPPAEGGPHYTGEPTHPGLAWSEGWATFFSSTQRDNALYYDKQQSMFFWLDLDARSYAPDTDLDWLRPLANQGLEQLIDENEVAVMLRKTQQSLGAMTPMLAALASERARLPPFERGYTQRTWGDDPTMFQDEGTSIPYLADFFDALRCDNGISAPALDLITQPAVHYPYLSGSPLCR